MHNSDTVENSDAVISKAFMSAGNNLTANSNNGDNSHNTNNSNNTYQNHDTTNFGNYTHIGNLTVHGYAKENTKEENESPFESFSRSENCINFDIPIHEEFIKEAIEKRILLLQCQHRDVLDSVFDRLAHKVQERFNGYSLQYLKYEPSEMLQGGGADKHSLKKVFFNQQKPYQNVEEKRLIFAKVVLSEQGRFFIEPILKASGISEDITEWRTLLSRQHVFLIFIVNDSFQLLKKEELAKLKTVLLHKKFPFLPYILKQSFGSEHIPAICKALHTAPEAECQEDKDLPYYLNVLEDHIERQRKNEQWASNESDFYTQIYNHIRNSPEELLLEVGRKGNQDQHAESAQILEKIARQFEEPQKRIFQTVYFAGVYFPKLRLREFATIVSTLLDKQTYEEQRVKEIVHAEAQPARQVFEQRNIDCKGAWEADQDHFLRLCFLQPTYTESDQQTIEFKHNYLRSSLKSTLEQEHPSFIQQQFNRLLTPVLINNDSSSSTKVIHNYIEFSIDMAKSDPQLYGTGLLNRIRMELIKIKDEKNQKEAEQKENRRNKKSDYNLDRALEQLREDNNILINRLSYLLRRMLATPELVSTQRQFLDRLINPHDNSYLSKLDNAMLLEVVERLYANEEFDALHWIKEVMYTGQGAARKDAYASLLRLLYARDEPTGAEMREIYNWIPKNPPRYHSGPPDFTGSELNAMVPFHLSVWCIEDVKEAKFGAIPPAFPLFGDHQTPEELEKELIFLINWLFHPIVFSEKEGLRTRYFNLSYTALDTIVDPFDVLEKWYMVLNGFDTSSANPFAEAFLRSLAACCKQKAGLKKNIIKAWLDKRNLYLKVINNVPLSYRRFREKARQRRNLLNDLIERTRPL